jgi:hypothetical protein
MKHYFIFTISAPARMHSSAGCAQKRSESHVYLAIKMHSPLLRTHSCLWKCLRDFKAHTLKVMQLTGSFLGSAVHAEHVHHNFADPRVEISSLHAARGQHIRGEQSAERLVATFVDSL